MSEENFQVEQHSLVPKHEKLSEEKVKEILAKYNITKRNLPKIKADDPAIKKLEAKEGDVIKITRDSPTAGKSVFYRAVLE